MHTEVRHLLDQADRDSEIRTVIITGAGDDFVLEQISFRGHLSEVTTPNGRT